MTTTEQDQSLNKLLSDLISRLAESEGDRILVRRDDIDPGLEPGLSAIIRTGLLRPAEPAKALVCDGCDRACPMEVQLARRKDGTTASFVVCDKRTDIGRVPADPRRLSQWSLSLEGIGQELTQRVRTSSYPYRLDGSAVWKLGQIASFNRGSEPVDVVLLKEIGTEPIEAGLAITLTSMPNGFGTGVVALTDLILFKSGRLTVSNAALKRALDGPRENDERVACEVRFGLGQILLVNHVTKQQRVLSRPNFDSTNDNAFQVLFENPGKKFRLAELRTAAGDQTIADLHKLVENLRFNKMLKTIFFSVSKEAIQFRRTVTIGELARHGIDPRSIA